MSTKNWVQFWVLGLAWGTSFLWIKIAVQEVSPLVLVGFRILFGSLGLLVVLLLDKNIHLRWQEIRPWIGIFTIVGLFNVALPFVLISTSEQYIDSGIAAILNSTVPLFSMIIAPLVISDERWTLPKFFGLLIGFGGVILLFLPELQNSTHSSLLGQGMMLLATLSYAIGAIYTRRKTQGGLPSRVQAFLQLLMATLMIWTVTFVVERPVRLPTLPITWLALLWLGLLGSCLAYILYFSLIHSIGPTRASMVTYVLPLVGILLGALFLKETLGLMELLGGALIVSGILVVNVVRKTRSPA